MNRCGWTAREGNKFVSLLRRVHYLPFSGIQDQSGWQIGLSLSELRPSSCLGLAEQVEVMPEMRRARGAETFFERRVKRVKSVPTKLFWEAIAIERQPGTGRLVCSENPARMNTRCSRNRGFERPYA